MGNIYDITITEVPIFLQKTIEEELSKHKDARCGLLQKLIDNTSDKITYVAFVESENQNTTLKYTPAIDKNKVEKSSMNFIL